jgi:hypothetical protein
MHEARRGKTPSAPGKLASGRAKVGKRRAKVGQNRLPKITPAYEPDREKRQVLREFRKLGIHEIH